MQILTRETFALEMTHTHELANPAHVPQGADAPVRPAAAGVIVPGCDALHKLRRRQRLKEAFLHRVLVTLVLERGVVSDMFSSDA